MRLSAQCTDERVNKITPALFERFPTLEAFAEADVAEVGEYIFSCGFYNTKARDLVLCAQMLLESGNRAALQRFLPQLAQQLHAQRNRTILRWAIDVDPLGI